MYTFRNGETQSGHWQNGILDVPSTQNTSHPVSPVAVYHSKVLNAVQVCTLLNLTPCIVLAIVFIWKDFAFFTVSWCHLYIAAILLSKILFIYFNHPNFQSVIVMCEWDTNDTAHLSFNLEWRNKHCVIILVFFSTNYLFLHAIRKQDGQRKRLMMLQKLMKEWIGQ
jgi:hypothetical protein